MFPLKRSALIGILVACLIAVAPTQSADAAGHRKWGQALDNYGAKLFACRLPEKSKHGPGFIWRYYLHAVNNSGARVVVAVRVKRWIFDEDKTIIASSWIRSVPIGRSTALGTVAAHDSRSSAGRFADYIYFRVRRPVDGQVIEWGNMSPTGAPRCDLPTSAISWQGSGYVSRTGGKIQLCSNISLSARGPSALWRVRGDARKASEPAKYQAKVARVSDGQVSASWSQTIPPGGYTQAGVLRQSLEIDPATNSWTSGFDIAITQPSESDTSFGSGMGPRNIC